MSKKRVPHLVEVDRYAGDVYCSHNKMGELHLSTHRHEKGQFLYTEGGIVHVITKEKSYFIPARHYMWIPPGLDHSITANTAAVILRNLYFPVRKQEEAFYHRIGIYPVNDMLLEMLYYTRKWGGRHVNKSHPRDFTFVNAIKAVLPEVSTYNLPLALPYPKDKRLLEVIRYMNQHLDEQLVVPEVAKQFGFSERSLSRLFRQDVGLPFVQFLKIQRMMRALQLLLETKYAINEITEMVGYNSMPTFSNTFHKIVGVSPTEYVKMKGVSSLRG